jgi:hypothetical protein
LRHIALDTGRIRFIEEDRSMLRRAAPWLAAILLTTLIALSASGQEDTGALVRRAETGLDKAIRYLRTEVATEGGYLWKYSEDLDLREGERKATPTQAWVQPPGTPTVGLAFVEAYEATHTNEARTAMMEAAEALIRGQYRSGGWGPHIEFDPALRAGYDYRVDRVRPNAPRAPGADVTTLDDNTTQSALLFLMRADKALGFKNERIHEAAAYALRKLIEAQYPNGAWPHKFGGGASKLKGLSRAAAAIPQSPMKPWDRHGGGPGQFTFNDHGMDRMVELFLAAGEIYNSPEFTSIAKKTGDFILQAQFPEPQPGWAQQYDEDMQPAWARLFEPPSLATSETQGILYTLMLLYEKTGDEKYLRPVPKTLAWLRRSTLPNGRFPRFIEFKTNQPLYVDKDRKVSNSPIDSYPGYGWVVDNQTDAIQRRYDRLAKSGPPANVVLPRGKGVPNGVLAAAKTALDTMDEQGRWVETGAMRAQGDRNRQLRLLNMQTAAKNITALAKLLYFAKPE